MTTPQLPSAPQWQNFLPDINNDVKPYLQIPTSVVTYDDVLREFTEMACWWIQDYYGRPIAPTTFFDRKNGYTGWGGSTIELQYYPVLGIPTVVEYWGNSGAHPLTFQYPASQGGADMFTFDARTGIITRSYLGLLARPTFPGLKNIEVTWTAGYQPIPPPVRVAAKELIQHWWRNTQEAVRVQRPMQDYDPLQAIGAMPAVPGRVKELLSTFQQVGLA